jgi:hypothetical protein
MTELTETENISEKLVRPLKAAFSGSLFFPDSNENTRQVFILKGFIYKIPITAYGIYLLHIINI